MPIPSDQAQNPQLSVRTNPATSTVDPKLKDKTFLRARSVFPNYQDRVATPAAAPLTPRQEGGAEGEQVQSQAQDPSITLAPEGPRLLQSARDDAIARSFLYRVLAKTYEYPAPENWQLLCSPTIATGFWSSVKVLWCEDTLAFAFGAAAELLREMNQQNYEPFLQDYLAVFGHAARGSCPLNEIEYVDLKADPLFQPHRLADLAAFYRAFGLEIAEDASERHDHLCLELEFMSVLAAKEAYALEYQLDEELLAASRATQKKFLREHLGRWTPAFARRLERVVEGGPLRALARFTGQFIETDCRRFGVNPGSDDLLLRPVDEAAESLCASCGLANLLPGATSATVEL